MTPYDHVFAYPDFEEKFFPEISAEAELHGMNAASSDDFLQLPAARDLIEHLSPPGNIAGPPIPAVASLAFHGYNFWRTGRNAVELDEPTMRALMSNDAEPIGTWSLSTPAEAGYIQFPSNLVWAQTAEGAPEPVHGFFYATSFDARSQGRIAVLVALGVRADRPGVTAIDIDVNLPVFAPGHFGDLDARDEGVDFANVLPGGELGGLHAVTNAGEVLKLVSRILHHLRVQPS